MTHKKIYSPVHIEPVNYEITELYLKKRHKFNFDLSRPQTRNLNKFGWKIIYRFNPDHPLMHNLFLLKKEIKKTWGGGLYIIHEKRRAVNRFHSCFGKYRQEFFVE